MTINQLLEENLATLEQENTFDGAQNTILLGRNNVVLIQFPYHILYVKVLLENNSLTEEFALNLDGSITLINP
jgi:hypothetical protein